jgi:hypothetical protein
MTADEFLQEYARQQEGRPAQSTARAATEAPVASVAGPAAFDAGSAARAAAAKPKAHQAIKLGIDVHLERYVVVRQLDVKGATHSMDSAEEAMPLFFGPARWGGSRQTFEAEI